MAYVRRALVGLLGLVALALLAFGGLVLWLWATDYKPPQVVSLQVRGTGEQGTPAELSLLTWNVGYAGLGAEQDFFLDGGSHGWPSPGEVRRYLAGITGYLQRHPADVVMLQEVDRGSKRVHYVNEVEAISGALPGYAWVFAKNYDVAFVPVPPVSPMGRVVAGQMTLSRWRPTTAERHALPGEYNFLVQLVQLDRCFILERIPAPDGREWVLINTHNSAFDAGQLREQQLGYIKEVMTREYAAGNYVVVGGDWNLILPGVDPDTAFTHTELRPEFYLPFPDDWTPAGWTWAYDARTPTNRSVSRPWSAGENYVTVIDGFLVSPNVEVLEVRTDDLDFASSDHNPVRLRLRARP
ncbi:endonuclease/exonuclease/phosphatase family protein [Oceanithermus sp.]